MIVLSTWSYEYRKCKTGIRIFPAPPTLSCQYSAVPCCAVVIFVLACSTAWLARCIVYISLSVCSMSCNTVYIFVLRSMHHATLYSLHIYISLQKYSLHKLQTCACVQQCPQFKLPHCNPVQEQVLLLWELHLPCI